MARKTDKFDTKDEAWDHAETLGKSFKVTPPGSKDNDSDDFLVAYDED